MYFDMYFQNTDSPASTQSSRLILLKPEFKFSDDIKVPSSLKHSIHFGSVVRALVLYQGGTASIPSVMDILGNALHLLWLSCRVRRFKHQILVLWGQCTRSGYLSQMPLKNDHVDISKRG